MIQVHEVNELGHAYADCGCGWKTGIFKDTPFVVDLGDRHKEKRGHAWSYPRVVTFTSENSNVKQQFPTLEASDRREMM